MLWRSWDRTRGLEVPGAQPATTTAEGHVRYSTSTTINATAEAIWDILVDLPSWTDWNTTVEEIEGRAPRVRR